MNSHPEAPKYRRAPTLRTFELLVALAAGAQTSAQLQDRIIGDTAGDYVKGSTMYSLVHRLQELRLVEPAGQGFSLTERGWHKLEQDTRVLESLVNHAKHRIIASGHGRW